MRKVSAFTGFFSILWIISSCAGQTKGIEFLEPEAFQKILTTPELQLIDVRTPEEYNEGHISGATNIDINGNDFNQNILTLDKTKPVAVYCLAGARSSQAAQYLKEQGFKTIYNLKGGMNAWNQKHLPVIGSNLTPQTSWADFQKMLEKQDWVLADFGATWCRPCQQLKPVLSAFETAYKGKVEVLPFDVDDEKILSEALKIDEIPLLVLYHKGKEVWRGIGFMEFEALKKEVDSQLKNAK